jgi:hypothetical protein
VSYKCGAGRRRIGFRQLKHSNAAPREDATIAYLEKLSGHDAQDLVYVVTFVSALQFMQLLAVMEQACTE